MSHIYIEVRNLHGRSISHDIAQHLYTRQLKGTAVVITDEPFLLMRVVRKRWLMLIKAVQRERSRTLDQERIAELQREITIMQAMQFAKGLPIDSPGASIYFLSPAQIDEILPDCHTAYIVTPHHAAHFAHLIHDHIVEGGLIVQYK